MRIASYIMKHVKILLLISCTSEVSHKGGRPTEETEEISGYLDSVEKDVSPSEAVEVRIGNTVVSIPQASADFDYKVRLSRRSAPPELNPNEALVLGRQESEVIEIEVFDPVSGNLLSSANLNKPYVLRQTIEASEAPSNLGLMTVIDAGTDAEKRALIPGELLDFSTAEIGLVQTKRLGIAVELKLTNAIVWLTRHTENAFSSIDRGNPSKLSSTGGVAKKIIRSQATKLEGAISINQGADFTNSQSVVLNLSSTDAAEVYLTNEQACVNGGKWRSMVSSLGWSLASSNGAARVFAKFRNAEGETSACYSSSIIHDDIVPELNGTITIEEKSALPLLTSPRFSWPAAADSGSGISHYELAVGTASGLADVQNWKSIGVETTGYLENLSLKSGVSYYPSVRAIDRAGQASEAIVGEEWTPMVNPPSNLGLVFHLDARKVDGVKAADCVSHTTGSWSDVSLTTPAGAVLQDISRAGVVLT